MYPTKKQLLDRIAKLESEKLMLELRLSLWMATFQKYQSWKANGVKGLNSVVADYEKLSDLMNPNQPCKSLTNNRRKQGRIA